jgi:hypothetical protein
MHILDFWLYIYIYTLLWILIFKNFFCRFGGCFINSKVDFASYINEAFFFFFKKKM